MKKIKVVNSTRIHHLAEIRNEGQPDEYAYTRCNKSLKNFSDNSRSPLVWSQEGDWLKSGVLIRHCAQCGTIAEFEVISSRDAKVLEEEAFRRDEYNKEIRRNREQKREKLHNELIPELYFLIKSYRNVFIEVELFARSGELRFTIDNIKFIVRGSC
jgi:hypothetical protein